MLRVRTIVVVSIVVLTIATAQTVPKASMDSCGLGRHKDHPCHCVEHSSKVQNDWIAKCQLENPKQDLSYCFKQMPAEIRDHCYQIENHWAGEGAADDGRMPDQCMMACKRGHCRCQDGPMCHIAHQASEDTKEDLR